MTSFDLSKIPSQKNRIALVTGANTGLGYETALELARLETKVILACRNKEKAKTAMERIKTEVPDAQLEFLELDLSSLESVKQAATTYKKKYNTLDLLINNAGIMALRDREETTEQYEKQFGVNHIGHFLLTGLLLPVLQAADCSRVVTLSSLAHKFGKVNFENLQLVGEYGVWKAYGQSKVANILFMMELDRRLKAAGSKTISVGAHPGFAGTDLQRHEPGWMDKLTRWMSQSAKDGAMPTLYAALGNDIEGGDYCGPNGFQEMRGSATKVEISSYGQDPEIAKKLWEVSEELTELKYNF